MKENSYEPGHPHQPGHETHNQRSRVVGSNTWEHWSPCHPKWGQPKVLQKHQCGNLHGNKRSEGEVREIRKGQVQRVMNDQ